LLKKREERHAMEFETVETYIKFNEKGGIDAILPRTRGDSQKLIEECMLLANTCAANFALKHELPVLYRNHDKPDGEKSMRIHEYAKNFGLPFPEENPTQADYQRIIEATKDRPDAISIHSMLLRSMMQANYAPDNIGHFGLAYDEYSHFTSPIRRYPDVMVHRLLQDYLAGEKSADAEFYEVASAHSSAMEKRAAEAERASIKYKQAEYLEENVGNVYAGIITGVTEWGMYVEIEENKCEGMVRLREISDDFYVLDEKNYCIVGQRKKKKYQLGDEVTIKVKKVDLAKRQIDFSLVI
jgi:ribonuclease R